MEKAPDKRLLDEKLRRLKSKWKRKVVEVKFFSSFWARVRINFSDLCHLSDVKLNIPDLGQRKICPVNKRFSLILSLWGKTSKRKKFVSQKAKEKVFLLSSPFCTRKEHTHLFFLPWLQHTSAVYLFNVNSFGQGENLSVYVCNYESVWECDVSLTIRHLFLFVGHSPGVLK